MVAELCNANGRTGMQADMTKPIVSFRGFANAPMKFIRLKYGYKTSGNINIMSHFRYIETRMFCVTCLISFKNVCHPYELSMER